MGSETNNAITGGSSSTRTTPEFIRWTLSRTCAIRDFDEATNPERADRQLRSLRLYCEGLSEGRLFQGVCLEPNVHASSDPLGFLLEEVLAAYGGLEHVRQWCSQCPANAAKISGPQSWGGCFGWFELTSLGDELHATIDAVIANSNTVLRETIAANFLPTRPTWFGLWASSPLTDVQVRCHLEIADALTAVSDRVAKALQDWRAALVAARDSLLPLHVAHFPSGVVQNNRWQVPACCERCHATRENPRKACPACGWTNFPSPSRRRHVQGIRPYRPLKSFMTAAEVAIFLQRYHEWRKEAGYHAEDIHSPTFRKGSADGTQP